MRRCTTRMRSCARVAVCCGCLALVIAVLAACNGDTTEMPSAPASTQPPPAASSPSPALAAPAAPTTGATVAAAPRPASTGTPTVSPEPAPTAQAPPTSVPETPPSTATAIPPSPSPSPAASPVASPSPSPSPTTPAATPSPAETERPTAAPTPAPTPARAVVGRIATALKVDGLQRPQDLADTFGLDDRVYISVEFRDVRAGARLGFRWSSGSCGGEYETGPQRALRRGFFAFYLDETTCVGAHAVEITVDGSVAAVTSFIIVGQATVTRP